MDILRKLSINLVLIALGFAIAFFVFEYAVRFTYPKFDPSGHIHFTESADGVVLVKKHGLQRQVKNTGDYDVTVYINKLGLRERKNLADAKPTDYFVVGDSFSFGWGVEEKNRYSNKLQRILRNHKIFNISTTTNFSGYDRLIKYSRKNGANIKNLIIGVCMENDLRYYGLKEESTPKKGEQNPLRKFISLATIKTYLTSNSAAYFFITSIIQNTKWLKNIAVKVGVITPNLHGINYHSFDIDLIKSSVQKLREISAPFNTIVLIIPSRALWVGRKEKRRATDQTHNVFVNLVRNQGIKVVDPRMHMESTNNPLNFHFKNDGHWNETAHSLAASMLAKTIKQ